MPLTEIETAVLEPDALEVLVSVLRARGYRVLGPRLRDGAITYDDLSSAAELPIGWTDVQQPGRYRVERRADAARFGYAVGPAWSRCPTSRKRASESGPTLHQAQDPTEHRPTTTNADVPLGGFKFHVRERRSRQRDA